MFEELGIRKGMVEQVAIEIRLANVAQSPDFDGFNCEHAHISAPSSEEANGMTHFTAFKDRDVDQVGTTLTGPFKCVQKGAHLRSPTRVNSSPVS